MIIKINKRIQNQVMKNQNRKIILAIIKGISNIFKLRQMGEKIKELKQRNKQSINGYIWIK